MNVIKTLSTKLYDHSIVIVSAREIVIEQHNARNGSVGENIRRLDELVEHAIKHGVSDEIRVISLRKRDGHVGTHYCADMEEAEEFLDEIHVNQLRYEEYLGDEVFDS